jgi:hypothetical protein
MKQSRIITLEVVNIDQIEKNMQAITKAMAGKPLTVADQIALLDTKSILMGIEKAFKESA